MVSYWLLQSRRSKRKKMNKTEMLTDSNTKKYDLCLWLSIGLAICSFLGALLSVGALLLILHCKKLRKRVSNKFLVSLFVSDFCVSFLVSTAIVKEWALDNPVSEKMPVYFYLFIATFMLLSLLNRTMVSVDRLVAVLNPYFYEEKFTTKLVILLTICQGVVGSVYLTLALIIQEIFGLEQKKRFVIYSIIVFAGIGFLTLTVSNIFIYREARKQIKIICKLKVGLKHKESEDSRKHHEYKIVRTFSFMIFLFVLCWTPFLVVVICKNTNEMLPKYTMFVVLFLLSLNYIFNPIIYVATSKDVKTELKKVCHRERYRLEKETAKRNIEMRYS